MWQSELVDDCYRSAGGPRINVQLYREIAVDGQVVVS